MLEEPVDGLIVNGTKTALPTPNIALYKRLWERNIPVAFKNGYDSQLKNNVHVTLGVTEVFSKVLLAQTRKLRYSTIIIGTYSFVPFSKHRGEALGLHNPKGYKTKAKPPPSMKEGGGFVLA